MRWPGAWSKRFDQASDMAMKNFEKYRAIIPKYTPIKPDQVRSHWREPYLRGFKELNETDIRSYQALVDVFHKEGVLQSPIAVRDKILKTTDFGS